MKIIKRIKAFFRIFFKMPPKPKTKQEVMDEAAIDFYVKRYGIPRRLFK